MIKERHDSSFKIPKNKMGGIKHPSMNLPTLEELDVDSADGMSDEEVGIDDAMKELNAADYHTKHKNGRKKYRQPSRRASEDVSEVSSFMDLISKKRPKTKVSNKNLLKSNTLTKMVSGDTNEILKVLANCKHESSSNVIETLEENQFTLKTALMAPLDDKEAPYHKYNSEDELFGVFLVVTNKNHEVFEYLWNTCGILWNESHLIPLIAEMVRVGWCKGLKKFFTLKRTQEIFVSLNVREKRYFYEDLADICETNLSDENPKRRIVISALLKALSKRPFATFTFLLLFRYIHELSIKIKTKEITLEGCNRDFYLLINDGDALYDLSVEFHDVCNESITDSSDTLSIHDLLTVKSKYHRIIHKLLHLSFFCTAEPIDVHQIWESIKTNDIGELKYIMENSPEDWSLILTLQDKKGKSPFCDSKSKEFNIIGNRKLEKLKPENWKPLHFMIYLDRIDLLYEFIQFAGKHIQRAMRIQSKKHREEEDSTILKLTVKHGSKHALFNLWKLPHQWSVKHLY